MSGHGLNLSHAIEVGEVTVRLARTGEHAKWDRLMRQHLGLGFNRFAGRSLRYILEYAGRWVCFSGWQTGSFKSAPRELWIGWRPEQQWCRLHLIVNNTCVFYTIGTIGHYVPPGLESHRPGWRRPARRTAAQPAAG